MPYQFTVSPDFTPAHLSGWYIFNTWLQKQTAAAIHLEMYDSFQAQRTAIQNDQVDLIYANPFDSATLVREKGFLPLVKAANCADEVIIAVAAQSPIDIIEQLKPGLKLAITEDPDVRLMGMMLLEPADIDQNTVQAMTCDSYIVVAKRLLRGQADAGIFLAEAFDDLSAMVKSQLKIVVRSQISVIHHALLAGPSLSDRRAELQTLLMSMNHDPKGLEVLSNLGFTAWAKVEDEEMEFMIDLMDTLSV